MSQMTPREIVEELDSSGNDAVRLKRGMLWPAVPSRMDVLVAHVLKNAGISPVREGSRIVLPAGSR